MYIFNHCYFSLTKVPSGADVFSIFENVHHVGDSSFSISLPLQYKYTYAYMYVCMYIPSILIPIYM